MKKYIFFLPIEEKSVIMIKPIYKRRIIMANQNVLELTQENFAQTISASTPVLVDFWASWCGPCKMMAPVIDELADEFAGKAAICKLNVDENTDLAAQYKVMSIPTILIFKDGVEVSRDIGVKSKDYFFEKINSML
jgi:thioredoxin 1